MNCIGSFMRWDAVVFKVNEIVHFHLTRELLHAKESLSVDSTDSGLPVQYS